MSTPTSLGLKKIYSGKVRDLYEIDEQRMLMVATDRLSAFDVVLPDPIPGKGEMLCQISNFWFEQTRHIIDNHLTGIDVASVLPAGVDATLYAKRAVVTKKLTPVPVRLTPAQRAKRQRIGPQRLRDWLDRVKE